jgi:L-ascorbate metabolism protein UlaG (beta-lactamase superfamily)
MTARQTTFAGALADDLAASAQAGVAFWWLGQAGFAFRSGNLRLMIDPYLSDSLAEKYRGRPLAHERLMPPPIAPEAVRGMDWCLCSHAHSDHMDPATLPILAARNPGCRFVAPRAEVQAALARGVPEARLVPVNAGEHVDLGNGQAVEAVASAHEELATDAAGQHRYLGYVLRLGGIGFYHSGDCVPYPGLAERLRGAGVSVALLPVNGRDAARTKAGIIGNFSFREAADLCREARIPWLVAHHVGLFAFNTVPEETLRREAARVEADVRVTLPRYKERYEAWMESGFKGND